MVVVLFPLLCPIHEDAYMSCGQPDAAAKCGYHQMVGFMTVLLLRLTEAILDAVTVHNVTLAVRARCCYGIAV